MAKRLTISELSNQIVQYNLCYRNIHKSLAKIGNIPLAQYYVLLILSQHGQLRMGEISQIISISRPNLTPLIDKLSEKNFVTRISDTNDQRVTFISITDRGFDVLQKEKTSICQTIEKKLGYLSDDEMQAISKSLNIIMEITNRV